VVEVAAAVAADLVVAEVAAVASTFAG